MEEGLYAEEYARLQALEPPRPRMKPVLFCTYIRLEVIEVLVIEQTASHVQCGNVAFCLYIVVNGRIRFRFFADLAMSDLAFRIFYYRIGFSF